MHAGSAVQPPEGPPDASRWEHLRRRAPESRPTVATGPYRDREVLASPWGVQPGGVRRHRSGHAPGGPLRGAGAEGPAAAAKAGGREQRRHRGNEKPTKVSPGDAESSGAREGGPGTAGQGHRAVAQSLGPGAGHPRRAGGIRPAGGHRGEGEEELPKDDGR